MNSSLNKTKPQYNKAWRLITDLVLRKDLSKINHKFRGLTTSSNRNNFSTNQMSRLSYRQIKPVLKQDNPSTLQKREISYPHKMFNSINFKMLIQIRNYRKT